MIRAVAIWVVAAVLLWAAGFFWFVHGFPPADTSNESTDAIVVLTGGSQRLESGLALLRDGKGRMLFVSGVNPQVRLAELLHVTGPVPDWAVCCVVLGREAESTLGNAVETTQWMRRQGYRSLRLVTAWYHMPRSLLEFRRAMPEIAIVPHPVFPEGVTASRWWQSQGTINLLIGEYDKYLAALMWPLAVWVQSGGRAAPAPR